MFQHSLGLIADQPPHGTVDPDRLRVVDVAGLPGIPRVGSLGL